MAEQCDPVHQHREYCLPVDMKSWLMYSAVSPIATSLRIQLLRFIFVRSSSLLVHRNTSTNHRTGTTELYAYTSLLGIPTGRRSSIIPLIAHVDESRQTTKTHPHTLVAGSNIFSPGSGGSSSNPAQSWS